jgi:uncharacterized membrane protein
VAGAAPAGGTWLALKVLPLCWPLAGLLKHRMYTYRWVSLLVWLYFTEGVVRAWPPTGARPVQRWRWPRWCCACVLFTACALHVRLAWRASRRLAAAPHDACPRPDSPCTACCGRGAPMC